MRRPRNTIFIAVLLVGAAVCIGTVAWIGPATVWSALRLRFLGRSTIGDRIREHGPAAEARLREHFARAGVAYPPRRLVLVGLKQERELLVLAADGDDAEPIQEVTRYRVRGASGGPGPKLRRGDQQVPEGFYGIESLNPNSLYHLSLRLDYPNAEDRKRAKQDGRGDLGGDIMIHGKDASVGCLAMGDPAIEELFVLVHRVGLENVEVVLSPSAEPEKEPAGTGWVGDLYSRIGGRLKGLGVASQAEGSR